MTDSISNQRVFSHGVQVRADDGILDMDGVVKQEFSWRVKFEALKKEHNALLKSSAVATTAAKAELTEANSARDYAEDKAAEAFGERDEMKKANIILEDRMGNATFINDTLRDEMAELKTAMKSEEAELQQAYREIVRCRRDWKWRNKCWPRSAV